ncbi:DEAD/DEAH box helicase [Desnuesiella massiliensis]|uniref:DEAD/DEAH box helicase n=1 Tax=Desnuesiella massiliensis TaxID=1650662 RepID=UPI0006E2F7A9|nr:DEAD/DEAH box helicase [Desnuesiella massiliensis]
MKVSETLIINYTDGATYKKGIDYYNNKTVDDFTVQIQFSDLSKINTYAIDTWVKSLTNNNIYNVQVSFNDLCGFTSFYCDCEVFSGGYRKRGICKHVVAVLLKYFKENEKKTLRDRNSLRTDKFIEEARSSIVFIPKPKENLNLDIKYCYERSSFISSSIEIKIGNHKSYIVKNITDFLNVVEGGGIYELSKNFVFDSATHRFSEKDRDILNIFLEINEINNLRYRADHHCSSKDTLINGKKLYLTNKYLKRLMSLLKNKEFECCINGKEYAGVKFKEENMSLAFKIYKGKEDFIIEHDNNFPIPLNNNLDIFFFQGNIYRPDEEQFKIYSTFYNTLINGRISFPNRDKNKLGAYIIPMLKIISTIKLEDNLKESFFEEALTIKAYIDREKDNVICSMTFCYGDMKIDAGDNSYKLKEDKTLIRNIKEELEALKILELLGFKEIQGRYKLEEEEDIFNFLREGILRLQEISQVYYSEEFKKIKVYKASSYRYDLNLGEEGLIDFEFSIEGVDVKELPFIFKNYREKKKYYRLKKGGFVDLEEDELKRIVSINEVLLEGQPLKQGKVLVNKSRTLYLERTLKDSSAANVFKNKAFQDFVKSISAIEEAIIEVPNSLRNVMREYQILGYKWFKLLSSYGFGGILADEMGLGKTLQAIAFILSEDKSNPFLIVAPTSLIYNWKLEFDKFAPDLKLLVISGDKYEREDYIGEIKSYDVVITSYALMRRDIDKYENILFQSCILDEAQNIKNHRSLNALSAKRIKAKSYFALTGTPIENSLGEFWSIFDFTMPGYLNSYTKFMQRYENSIVKYREDFAMEELCSLVKPFVLKRTKKQVISELPPKIEHKILVEMTEEQKQVYFGYLLKVKEELKSELKEDKSKHNSIKIFSALTRLRQICVDPSAFIENFKGDNGKFNVLSDLLEQCIASGHKILVFSQFSSILKKLCKKLNKQKISHLYLDGQIPSDQRMELVKEFNDGEHKVFLISLKAGGTGLNLTSADVVIHLDPWWNPAVEQQASDRCHRIGQTKVVEVIKLICKDTIEEKIYNIQEKKKDIISAIEDKLDAAKALEGISIEEILELLE